MSNSDSLERKLLKNATWLFSGGIGNSVFAAVEPVVLARFLGVEQFGLLSLVIAYVSIVNGIIDFKPHEAVVKYVVQYKELGEKVKALSYIKLFYILDFLAGALGFAVCVLLAGVANDLFIHSDKAVGFVLVYSVSMVFSNLNKNSEAVLRVFDRFKMIALVRTCQTALRLVLVSACLLAGFGITGVLTSYVITAFLVFVALQAIVFATLRNQGLERWTKARLENAGTLIREVRMFVLTSTFSGFLENIAFRKQFPILLLGYFSGNAAAGFYKVATIFSSVIDKFLNPAIESMYPSLVAAHSHGDYQTFKRIVSYSVKSLAKILLPIGVVFFLLVDHIVLLFFGTEYADVSTAMRISVAINVLGCFCFWVGSGELAMKRLKQRMTRSIVLMAVYATALLILIPAYSYEGAVMATLAHPIVISAFALYLFSHIGRLQKGK